MLELHTKPKIIHKINEFLYTPGYFLLLGFLTVLSNTASVEIFSYTCFAVIVTYTCLFAPDLLPIMPLSACCYIATSRNNNPGINTNSVFSASRNGAFMVLLVVLIVASLVYRLLSDKNFGGKKLFKCKRKLLVGMLFLGATYLLSGLGSPNFLGTGIRNIVFALIEFVALIGMYFLITSMVDWGKASKSYLAWTGICIGLVLIFELLFIYLSYGVLENGIINRDKIYTGWGHYNNIGALLTMMIPFPFYLVKKQKNNWLLYFLGMLFFVGVIFTCSRGSILIAVPVYIVSYILSLLKPNRVSDNKAIHVATALLVVMVLIIFSDKLFGLFEAMLSRGFDGGDRVEGYKAGIKQFLSYPVFGGSFFPVEFDELYNWATSQEFTYYFPARWHNTFLQILASCGVVGFVAYIYHRVDTAVMFLRRSTKEKWFVMVSVGALLLMSMIDCHLFNVGPTIIYSFTLAFAEKKLSDN